MASDPLVHGRYLVAEYLSKLQTLLEACGTHVNCDKIFSTPGFDLSRASPYQ